MPILSGAIPTLPVRNLGQAVLFYETKLGFKVRYREGGMAMVVRDEVELQLTQLNDEGWKTRPDFLERPIKSGAESFIPGTASCHVRVDDAAALYAECAPKGIVHPNGRLTDQWWGDRDFGVLDADRNLIRFFQRGAVPRQEPPRG